MHIAYTESPGLGGIIRNILQKKCISVEKVIPFFARVTETSSLRLTRGLLLFGRIAFSLTPSVDITPRHWPFVFWRVFKTLVFICEILFCISINYTNYYTEINNIRISDQIKCSKAPLLFIPFGALFFELLKICYVQYNSFNFPTVIKPNAETISKPFSFLFISRDLCWLYPFVLPDTKIVDNFPTEMAKQKKKEIVFENNLYREKRSYLMK